MPLPDCLGHVSFSRYSQLSAEVVEKLNKCQSFLAPLFSEGMTPTFVGQIVTPVCIPMKTAIFPFMETLNLIHCHHFYTVMYTKQPQVDLHTANIYFIANLGAIF